MQRTTFMNGIKSFWVVGLVAAVGCQLDAQKDDQDPGAPTMIDIDHPRAVPDEYIVVFRKDVSADKIAVFVDAMRNSGMGIMKAYSVIPGFAGRFSAAELDSLRGNLDIEYIEANKYVSTNAIFPNPPYGLDRIDQRTGTDSQYNDFGFDGSGVHVYIIDTGIRTTHSEFTGRVGNGFSAIDNDPSLEDCNGHGSHVASTAVGTKFGVAKKAIVHPVRVLNCSGVGTFADVIEGMDWVRTNHAPAPSVVNMSLSGPQSTAVNDAVANLTAAGVAVVVAAGNSFASNACASSPSSAPSAITVGATSPGEVRADFSNVGPCLDLFAPGVNVLGAGIANDNATATLSGTSMASPHVAGAVATYLQRFPRLPVSQVNSAVVDNATTGVVGDARGSANLFLDTNFGTPVGNSCFGRCGGQSPDFSCGCDQFCQIFGDCCPDFGSVCH